MKRTQSKFCKNRKSGGVLVWKNCRLCGNKMKRFRIHKGNIICFKCYQKKILKIYDHLPHQSLEKALNKEYVVKGYLNSCNNSIQSEISVPSILTGHKVKLILIDDVV